MNLISRDTLDVERWRRIESVLDLALEAAPGDVTALLDRECATHPELRCEIEALLEADRRATGLMVVAAAQMLDPFAPEAAPTRIGRYVVTGTLGRGGMGIVYEAHDERLGRRVALKALPAGFTQDPARLERFLCEARLLGALQDPHLAAFFGIAREGDSRYLVLERIHGETLAARLEHGALPMTDALDVIEQIADALAAVHALGIVHRDLKPGNVMLTADGLVKLLDLGLAETAAASGEDSRGWLCAGTPGWMSPEQIVGGTQDARSDLFAWGALAWQCLTGEMAFGGATAQERMAATLERTLDPAMLPDGTPADVRRMIGRSLEQERERRPASALEIAAAFPLASGAAPSQTPRASTRVAGAAPFVGRERERNTATALLARARLVTLVGAGGCGKSRLAQEIAAGHDGTLWTADLTAVRDVAGLESALAAAAGLRDVTGDALVAALAAAATADTWLLLDACEHLPAACASITAALLARSLHIRILATSREPLGIDGEQKLRVPPLALPAEDDRSAAAIAACEAVQLFESCAQIALPGFALAAHELSLAATICRRLEGIPLAIELVAARLREQPLAALAAETATGTHDADHALAAAIDASLARLDEHERRFFRALAVFEGGWNLETAAAVACPESDRFVALDALTQLLDRSLITVLRAERAEPRYRFLDPIRQVALARAEAATELPLLCARHRDAHLGAVERLAPALTSGAAQGRALAWLESEHENVIAALEWDEPGEVAAQKALRLAGAVWWFWYVRGHFARGRAALRRALARPAAAAPTPARALALFAAGGLAVFQGDRVEGRRRSLEALALFEAQGDALGIARASSHVALCDADDGRFEDAAHGYARAIAIFRALGDQRRLSATLNNLGVLDRLRDDFAAAWTHHAEALSHFRQAGDRDGTVVTLLNLALAGSRLDRGAEAARALDEALALVLDLRARRAGAAALEVAAALLSDHDDDAAARLLGAATALRTAIRLPADAWWQRMTSAVQMQLAAALGAAELERRQALGGELGFEQALAWARATLSTAFGSTEESTPHLGERR